MSRYGSYNGWSWPKYVSVAERRANAAKEAKRMEKSGQKTNPVVIAGRTIASTFWGKSWCQNLESYSDYANRLPRGRTYVRNGSVIDLQITSGLVQALVMGSSLYKVDVAIVPMVQEKWQELVKSCSGHIDSLIELLQGKFSKAVMEIITESNQGLFPKPREIKFKCSCPDSASMCKHVAAVMYGVGASLDNKPEWLFALRQVDHMDLIVKATTLDSLTGVAPSDKTIAEDDLSAIFGIDMAEAQVFAEKQSSKPVAVKKRKVAATKTKTKKTAKSKVKVVSKSKVKKRQGKTKGTKLP